MKRNQARFAECVVDNFKEWKRKDRFDFVAANLHTADLIAMHKKLLRSVRPGKYLAVSGIALDNLTKLRAVFDHPSLRCLRVLRGRQWAALLYRRMI